MRGLAGAAFAAAMGLVCAVPATGALAQELGDVEAGQAFARQVCAECHAVEGGDAASPHPDAPTFQTIADVPGMTGTAIIVILRNPHRQMPDLILTRDELHDVAAYILSLRSGETSAQFLE